MSILHDFNKFNFSLVLKKVIWTTFMDGNTLQRGPISCYYFSHDTVHLFHFFVHQQRIRHQTDGYWKPKIRIVLQAVNGRLWISDAFLGWDQRLPSFLATALSFFESTRPNPTSSSSRSSSTWAASCRNSKEFIVIYARPNQRQSQCRVFSPLLIVQSFKSRPFSTTAIKLNNKTTTTSLTLNIVKAQSRHKAINAHARSAPSKSVRNRS